MRFQQPIPCYLHPEWAAPETAACLHQSCLGGALQPHIRGLIGQRVRILRAGYKLKGMGDKEILEDIALEMLARYKKIDVPVNYTVGSFLSAIERAGVNHWGWACWEPDWERGAGKSALEDSIEDVQIKLDQLQADTFSRMTDPMTHNPEQALRNLQLAAQATKIPQAVLGHLLGEITTADLVRLGISSRSVSAWTSHLRKAYLEGAYAH